MYLVSFGPHLGGRHPRESTSYREDRDQGWVAEVNTRVYGWREETIRHVKAFDRRLRSLCVFSFGFCLSLPSPPASSTEHVRYSTHSPDDRALRWHTPYPSTICILFSFAKVLKINDQAVTACTIANGFAVNESRGWISCVQDLCQRQLGTNKANSLRTDFPLFWTLLLR